MLTLGLLGAVMIWGVVSLGIGLAAEGYNILTGRFMQRSTLMWIWMFAIATPPLAGIILSMIYE